MKEIYKNLRSETFNLDISEELKNNFSVSDLIYKILKNI